MFRLFDLRRYAGTRLLGNLEAIRQPCFHSL